MLTPRHGTRTRYRHGCRCTPCTTANAAYERGRRRRIAYGRRPGLVDATQARDTIARLHGDGYTIRQIAAAVGVSPATISRAHTWTLITPTLHTAVTTAHPDPDPRHVDATGTRHRLQALACIGWTANQLAAILGRRDIHTLTTRATRVTPTTSRAVTDLYHQLAHTPPPRTPGTLRTLHTARRHGWAPPSAWIDDAHLDDPHATPNAHHNRRPDTDLAAHVTDLINLDEHPDMIVTRAGYRSRASLMTQLRRTSPDAHRAYLKHLLDHYQQADPARAATIRGTVKRT